MVTIKRNKSRRFTVTLSEEDYQKLHQIATNQRPPLTLQYVVNWGIQRILERVEDPQLMLELGNPVAKKSR